MVRHFCVKFGDPSCSGVCDIVWKNRQTHKCNCKPYPVTIVGVGNKNYV